MDAGQTYLRQTDSAKKRAARQYHVLTATEAVKFWGGNAIGQSNQLAESFALSRPAKIWAADRTRRHSGN